MLAVFTPDDVELLAGQAQLGRDLGQLGVFLGRYDVIRGHHREARLDQCDSLVFGRVAGEFTGNQVVLRGPVEAALMLGDLDHEHGLRLGQATYALDDLLHQPRLCLRHAQIGVGGAGQDVGKPGQVAPLLRGQRLELGHDAPDRGRLLVVERWIRTGDARFAHANEAPKDHHWSMPQVARLAGRQRRLLPGLAAVLVVLALVGCGAGAPPGPTPGPRTPDSSPSAGTTADATPAGSPAPTLPLEPTVSPPIGPTTWPQPTPPLSVESAAQAAALVLDSDEIFLGVAAPQLELAGQCCWYQAHEAIGHHLVTVEVGWGDCRAGCVWTHRWLYQVDPDGTLTLREQEGDEPVERVVPPASGTGTVTIVALAGPVCPVEPFPPDPDCAPQPVDGALMAVFDARGQQVQQAATGSDGLLVLELPAGAYYVVPAPVDGLMGTPSAQAFSIGGGDHLPVRFDYDTGIR